jgi:hypothetical protein
VIAQCGDSGGDGRHGVCVCFGFFFLAFCTRKGREFRFGFGFAIERRGGAGKDIPHKATAFAHSSCVREAFAGECGKLIKEGVLALGEDQCVVNKNGAFDESLWVPRWGSQKSANLSRDEE